MSDALDRGALDRGALDRAAWDGRALPAHRYRAFGLLIASELALPELASMRDDSGAAPDVTIRLEAPGDPAGVAWPPRLRPDARGATLAVAGAARYRIEDGCRIGIAPYPAAPERDVRLYLLGSAFGVLCHQRGVLPLHGNAVIVDGRAMAFCGHSGIGKSTLAAHFAARGYALLCDDVCVVSFDAAGRPLAWPGLPRLKLWRDAAENFGHDPGTLERAIQDKDKYHVPNAAVTAPGPFPLARVYLLSDATESIAISPVAGVSSIQAIMAQTYRKVYLRPMGLVGANIEQATRIAQHAQVFAAPRRRGFDCFADEAARLERHMAQDDAAPVARAEGSR